VTDALGGRIGEGWAGEAPNGSHINVVIGRRGSAAHGAIVGALASPRPGHRPFQVCLELGTAVRPTTIFVNKATLAGDEHGRLTWGAGQVGVAQGVLDAVAEGLLPAEEAAELVLLAAVWIDPAASDETALKQAARTAMRSAIADAVSPPAAAEVRALAERREEANTPYYTGA
jgi:5,6,7,8-tetrahydromethanopterin hydro-lyase